jgi:hypothetical protein
LRRNTRLSNYLTLTDEENSNLKTSSKDINRLRGMLNVIEKEIQTMQTSVSVKDNVNICPFKDNPYKIDENLIIYEEKQSQADTLNKVGNSNTIPSEILPAANQNEKEIPSKELEQIQIETPFVVKKDSSMVSFEKEPIKQSFTHLEGKASGEKEMVIVNTEAKPAPVKSKKGKKSLLYKKKTANLNDKNIVEGTAAFDIKVPALKAKKKEDFMLDRNININLFSLLKPKENVVPAINLKKKIFNALSVEHSVSQDYEPSKRVKKNMFSIESLRENSLLIKAKKKNSIISQPLIETKLTMQILRELKPAVAPLKENLIESKLPIQIENNKTIQKQELPLQIVPNDSLSCTNCEEIYKEGILNNKMSNIIQCASCKNFINETSLEFYLQKYKNEVLELKKREISSAVKQRQEEKIDKSPASATSKSIKSKTTKPTLPRSTSSVPIKSADPKWSRFIPLDEKKKVHHTTRWEARKNKVLDRLNSRKIPHAATTEVKSSQSAGYLNRKLPEKTKLPVKPDNHGLTWKSNLRPPMTKPAATSGSTLRSATVRPSTTTLKSTNTKPGVTSTSQLHKTIAKPTNITAGHLRSQNTRPLNTSASHLRTSLSKPSSFSASTLRTNTYKPSTPSARSTSLSTISNSSIPKAKPMTTGVKMTVPVKEIDLSKKSPKISDRLAFGAKEKISQKEILDTNKRLLNKAKQTDSKDQKKVFSSRRSFLEEHKVIIIK